MKIKGLPGEFGFKALIKGLKTETQNYLGWTLTESRYFSLDEIPEYKEKEYFAVKWPVEVYEDGSVYIPHEDELK